MAITEKDTESAYGPRLNRFDQLARKVTRPFNRAMNDIGRMQVTQARALTVAIDAQENVAAYLLEELQLSFPEISIILAGQGDIPAEGECILVNTTGSFVNFSRGDDTICLAFATVIDGEISNLMLAFLGDDERVIGERGQGIKGKIRSRVSDRESLDNSLISLFSPASQLEGEDDIIKVMSSVRGQMAHTRMNGNVLLSALDVASGKSDGFVGLNLLPQDVLIADFLIRESSGTSTDAKAQTIDTTSTTIVAGSMKIHGALLKTLR